MPSHSKKIKASFKLFFIVIFFLFVFCQATDIYCADLDDNDPNTFKDVYWVGHLVPDADSICAAIGAAYLYGGIPARAGDLNKETKFVLNYFHSPAPVLVDDFSSKKVGIVDFNQQSQLQKTIKMENIVAVIDHHSLSDNPFNLSKPLSIDIRPWGSASTIIADRLIKSGKPIPKDIAGVLLSAILSDTVLMTSETTTRHDKELITKLAKVAQINNIQQYGMDMLTAKSNFGNASAKDIITMDMKMFYINKNRIAYAVAETITPDALLKRKQELLNEMNRLKIENRLNYIFFAIVDLINKRSYILLSSDKEIKLASKAYGIEPTDNIIVLNNAISRKLNLLPPIQKTLSK
ncbi:MAG: putative manganese-dependent inorganic pyrophosphatase [Syntrophorhabdus sp. PtaU1.Bin058]|nr:MAG: putative manganese-dependent inorganic pyrophosphatase [Syntrophorhabdus sp. PtaU1.Bin058]